MTQSFDFNQALEELKSGKGLTGKDGILTPLIKQLTEAALKAELDAHIEAGSLPNRKNGVTKKTIKSPSGHFELATPRDRNGSFEPQLVRKHQTYLTPEIEGKVLSMFSHGMSYKAIREHISDMYAQELSNGTLSAITDKLIPKLEQWQQRPLQSHYPIVWLDAIHYKVKIEGRYISQAVYTVLGLTVEGKKDILGLYLSENEGANYWVTVLTELQNRGVQDILIACVDGLSGFPDAIAAVYPKTEVQLCVIHKIRNAMKYVGSKNQKAFMTDLKSVYKASTLHAAETALDKLETNWGELYPLAIQTWRNHWQHLSAYFKYPEPIRRIIYTTNAVEAVHRQYRKLTKTKGAFPNQHSLLKLLYAGILNASKNWTMPVQNWSQTLSQLAMFFEGRLDSVLDI
jgi:transposase-like protein